VIGQAQGQPLIVSVHAVTILGHPAVQNGLPFDGGGGGGGGGGHAIVLHGDVNPPATRVSVASLSTRIDSVLSVSFFPTFFMIPSRRLNLEPPTCNTLARSSSIG
jgi:hypothetical protein